MKIRTWLKASAICVPLLTGPALEAEQGAASGPENDGKPAQGAAPVDGEAMAILGRMAERLARADGFSVSIRSGYDVVQETGQKIEFGEERKVLLRRPGGLRVEAEQSDGDRRVIVFDGRTISVSDPDQNVYASGSLTGGGACSVRPRAEDPDPCAGSTDRSVVLL